MAKNQRYTEAKHIAIPAPRDVQSGDPVQTGNIAGVALIDAEKGEKVTVWLDGSWMLPVGQAVKVGQQVNISTAGKLTTGSGAPFGVALEETAESGDAEIAPFGLVAASQAPAPSGD